MRVLLCIFALRWRSNRERLPFFLDMHSSYEHSDRQTVPSLARRLFSLFVLNEIRSSKPYQPSSLRRITQFVQILDLFVGNTDSLLNMEPVLPLEENIGDFHGYRKGVLPNCGDSKIKGPSPVLCGPEAQVTNRSLIRHDVLLIPSSGQRCPPRCKLGF